ncbi:MAG TPA: SLC13 family permease [Gemmatimonadales bacterium]|nr:SLC13 family permease [Gemmatimonadales bacterium]
MEHAIAVTQDPVSQGIVAAVIVAVFALLAMEKAHRVLVIFSAVALLWLITYFTPWHLITFEGAHQALDLNVLLLLASMMAVVGVLKTTGVFDWAVGRLIERTRGRPGSLMAMLVWFTGLLSAVCDNVTTVIFVYPMAIRMAAATGIRPAALLLPMVIASNIGGTATLIGDPPNILIGSGAGLSFFDFIENLTMPVLWMLVACLWFSRRYYRSALAEARPAAVAVDTEVIQQPLLLKWSLAISALIFVGFFTHSLTGMPVAVPAAIGAAMILVAQDWIMLRTHRPTHGERVHGILNVIEREIEWPTLAFFAFLFIAVGAAVGTGLIDTMAGGLERFIGWGSAGLGLSETGTLLFAALMVLWVSGLLSALIDNIPYVAVTIPLIARLVGGLTGDTEILWWALSLGACLGGNGSAIGASANVTVIGLADKSGQHISFGEFTRFGASMATITLVMSSLFIAAHLYLGKLPTLYAGAAALGAYFVFNGVRRREVSSGR